MRLDCLTPRGRAWVAQQRETARAFAARWGVDVVETPEGTPAAVDAFFARDGVLVGVAEIKCRSLNLAQLRGFGDYLITEEKLRSGCDLSARLCVPFVLIVRLADAIIWWRITDRTGRPCLTWDARVTATQATCNGGLAVRTNAYLPLDDMGRIGLVC